MAKHTATWKTQLSKGEYESALSYLTLQLPTRLAQRLVRAARDITPTQRIAKDVLRASRLPLLRERDHPSSRMATTACAQPATQTKTLRSPWCWFQSLEYWPLRCSAPGRRIALARWVYLTLSGHHRCSSLSRPPSAAAAEAINAPITIERAR